MNFAQFRTIFLSLPHTEERPHFDQVSFYIKDQHAATYHLRDERVSLSMSHSAQDILAMMHVGSHRISMEDQWVHIHQSPYHDGLIMDAIRHSYAEYGSMPSMIDDQSGRYTVTHQVVLGAPQPVIWDVLTVPRHISVWDDLPSDMDIHAERIQQGQDLIWQLPTGDRSIMSVERLEHYKSLQYKLYVSGWPLLREFYDVTYSYELISNGFSTLLSMKFGDFGMLPEPDVYTASTRQYALTVAQKLKVYVAEFNKVQKPVRI